MVLDTQGATSVALGHPTSLLFNSTRNSNHRFRGTNIGVFQAYFRGCLGDTRGVSGGVFQEVLQVVFLGVFMGCI